MMKFFRKYNKTLLAVFMVLLMIVFLGGSALDSMLAPSGDRQVATSAVGPISYTDQRVAEVTRSILSSLGLDAERPLPAMTEPLDPIDWIILSREAGALGLPNSVAAVRSLLPDEKTLNELARQLRRKPARIMSAMAEYSAIRQAAFTVAGPTAPSQAEVLAAARKSLEKVRIDVALLPAEAFMDAADTPSREEIEAQYTAYRSREAGGGVNFGYYVPPAVQIQFIKINRDAIAGEVRAGSIEKKARAYYDTRRDTEPAFRRPPETPGPSEDPIEGPPAPPYLAWNDVKDIALDIIRKQEADAAVDRIANWLVSYAGDGFLDSDRGDDGYRPAPENVAKPAYYDGLIENVPATIAYPGTLSTTVTEFFNEDEANRLPEIGIASFAANAGGFLATVRNLAFKTQGLIPEVPKGKGVDTSAYLATFQTSRLVLRGISGNKYVFRVVAAQPGHVPESVDEVRQRVVADLRLLKGYEVAKARAESLRSCETSESLAAAYETDDELITLMGEVGPSGGYFAPPAFARVDRFRVVLGIASQGVRVGGGVGLLPNDVVEDCFALTDADNKIRTFELKERATVMVVEWLETQRATVEDFDATKETLAQQLAASRMQAALSDWMKPDNIRARNQFELLTN